MSWMQKLYNTYNQCEAWKGQYPPDGKRPLAPICHITKDAHIQIALDQDGNIQGAQPITNKIDMITIIPATEDSAGRTGGPAPHPLVDEIRYLAGDYIECGGRVPKIYKKDESKARELYEKYKNLLSGWSNSEFSQPKVRAVLRYIEKGTLVKDLAQYGIFHLGSDGKFLPKKDIKRNKDDQDIFAVPNMTNQDEAVIRWKVEIDDGTEMYTWRDESLQKSWSDYYRIVYLSERKAENGAFCYVTGKETILTNKHPKYIRKKGDNPKLISSDDGKGFTYRGRFESADEACLVGLETSQKAHNALAWLIDRQGTIFWEKDGGKTTAGLTILAWESSAQKEIPQPTRDSVGIGLYDDVEDELDKPAAGQQYATRLHKKILGYKAALEHTPWIYIIALDSLSQGRMAIAYYQEFQPEVYLEKVEKWHRECAWTHHYLLPKFDDLISTPQKPGSFIGAPAPLDIAEVVHGKKASAKIKHHTVARLFPCIIEGHSLPRDVVDAAIRQASKRMALYDPEDKKIGDEEYTWRKSLTIACALFRKYTLENTKEDYPMALDLTRTKRDYLYGRLLAIADLLETKALKDAEGKQKRSTNAARYMQQFSQHPFRTWKLIHEALNPYILGLGGKAIWYKDQFAEVSCLFVPGEFESDAPLTGEYLLGYYCQWQELRKFGKDALPTSKDQVSENTEEESEDGVNEYDDDEDSED